MSQPLFIDIQNLNISFGGKTVVSQLNLQLKHGESIAFVGESGSGKTVTARSLLGLQDAKAQVTAERFLINGEDMRNASQRRWRKIRGTQIGYVLQDALVSLDPLRQVGQQLRDALQASQSIERGALRAQSIALLQSVGIPDAEARLAAYPHQLSGGLRQRALIATALAGKPNLLIADEPTTALDMTVQKQILELLQQRRDEGQSLLLISHDLSVVGQLADRVLVMKNGVVVEEGSSNRLLLSPQHAYTQQLLAAVPSPETRGFKLAGTPGERLPAKNISGGDPVLIASGLYKQYADKTVVNHVSFSLAAGETLGIVGESGSGKTTVAKMVMGLTEPSGGTITIKGHRWSQIPESVRRLRRRGIQLIAQDPLSSFDPRYSVEKIIGESLDSVEIYGDERKKRILQLLDEVQLGASFLSRYPRDLSGGQRQRIAIARAFAPNPALLVADEPVSALDVSVQAQVLDLLAEMQAEHRTALLFISHDLGVVHHLADRVAVMKDGVVVEHGEVDNIFNRPAHPWTRQLINALPS
ncbi:ABC transporter ATP-binding protein [Rouxiella silvae]|uniref:ABC-type dipeptide transporter n=1 Tax=Rouxiella silvae TaxID=1646373 RepID=A0AA40X296_9GAMM|nr:ABC transporter ATP-binding protein [Rouxiella silvae]MBF6637387.1 ABC transporter ATP-binding protein [Rouxiella silvae]ORJ19287.1 ABC transporter ATP-binding protein [Rouxiella silvae]